MYDGRKNEEQQQQRVAALCDCEVRQRAGLSRLPGDDGSAQGREEKRQAEFALQALRQTVSGGVCLSEGGVTENQTIVLKMRCRGGGVRDGEAVTAVSRSTVPKLLKTVARGSSIKPAKQPYHRVRIDEQRPYAGKKKKKGWMLYASAVEEDGSIAFARGKRSAAAVKNLLVKPKDLDIEFFLPGDWDAFPAVLPQAKHRTGKRFTQALEGVNAFFRTRSKKTRTTNRVPLKKTNPPLFCGENYHPLSKSTRIIHLRTQPKIVVHFGLSGFYSCALFKILFRFKP